MNQWQFPVRSSLVHSEDPYSVPYQAVVHTKNSLMHYGIKGQKWGVITKEYEPVAVDHRKLRKAQALSYRVSTRPRTVGSQQSTTRQTVQQQREAARRDRKGYWTRDENGRPVWKQNGKTYSPSEERQKIVRKALIGAGVVAGLLITYGAVKMHQVKTAKAYSGILNRFIQQNPIARQNTDAGRKMLKRGMELAKANSSSKSAIKATNSYLNRKALVGKANGLSTKNALKIYKGRKAMEKQLNYAFDRKKVLKYLRRFGKM